MSELAIELAGLRKRFGDFEALRGVDLSVPEGSVFGFLGRNGAGKTTTLRILTGLAWPTQGTAKIFGADVAHSSGQSRSLVGFLPDVPSFYPWMTAEEFLRFAGGLFGLERDALKQRVGALLELSGLSNVRSRIGGFSRGMKQRLGIAQALINSPRLLMLDEPTSALDPMGRKEVLELVSTLAGRTTVFFSSHLLGDVERVCDRVAILDAGRVVVQAPVEELRAKASSSRMELEVAAGAEALAGVLGQLEWAAKVERQGQVLSLEVANRDEAGRQLPALLAQRGLVLRRLELKEPSLEEVFVSLVGKGS